MSDRTRPPKSIYPMRPVPQPITATPRQMAKAEIEHRIRAPDAYNLKPADVAWLEANKAEAIKLQAAWIRDGRPEPWRPKFPR